MTPHSIAVLLPTYLTEIGHWSLAVMGLLWLLIARVSAQATDDLERLLARAVSEAIVKTVGIKEAAARMGYKNESQLHKVLRAEPSHHVSLTRLVRVGFLFWIVFLPMLSALVIEQHLREVCGDVKAMAHDAKALWRST